MKLPDGTWEASVGGVILGMTATAMLAATGKLVGVSGILDGAISRAAGRGWKVVFLSGLTAGGIAAGILYPEGVDQTGAPPMSPAGFVASGILVGLGTRLGNGCTSGHGLCGLPRLSRRSLIATLTFLTSGVATATVLSAWRSDSGLDTSGAQVHPLLPVRYAALALAALGTAWTMRSREERADWRAHSAAFFSGGTFAGSLVLSGMVRRAKVIDFLALRRDTWDPSLMFVLGFGVMTTLIGFPVVIRALGTPACARPVAVEAEPITGTEAPARNLAKKFDIPTNTELDAPLILGAWLFGVGWGSSGLCPGPAFVAAAYGLPGQALAFLPAVAVGMKLAGPMKNAVSLPPPTWMMGSTSAEPDKK